MSYFLRDVTKSQSLRRARTESDIERYRAVVVQRAWLTLLPRV